jgi:hypothetical protein
VAAAAVLALVGPLAQKGRADSCFTLRNDEQLTVNTSYSAGWLYDQSRADIVSGGSVGNHDSVENRIFAYNSSTVNISGGWVGYLSAYDASTVALSGGRLDDILRSYDSSTVSIFHGADIDHVVSYGSSTVTISGGLTNANSAYGTSTWFISGGRIINGLGVYNASTVDISGGSMYYLNAEGCSTVRFSGGQVNELMAWYSSTVTFNAQDFCFGPGLSLDGDRVLGTGILGGEWFDGTSWAVNISRNTMDARILVGPGPVEYVFDPNLTLPNPIPEPASVVGGLIGLGMIGRYIKKHRLA